MARQLVKVHNRGQYERKESILSQDTQVGSSFTTVSGTQLSLSPGTHLYCYNFSVLFNNNTGNSNVAIEGSFVITDSNGNQFDASLRDVRQTFEGAGNSFNRVNVSGCAEINLSSTKTIEVRGKDDGDTDEIVTVLSNSSVVWAERKREES